MSSVSDFRECPSCDATCVTGTPRCVQRHRAEAAVAGSSEDRTQDCTARAFAACMTRLTYGSSRNRSAMRYRMGPPGLEPGTNGL